MSGSHTPQVSAGGPRQVDGDTAGRWLLAAVTAAFLVVAAPVVLKGVPLADDYHTCLRPVIDGGYGPYLADIRRDAGMVRPARYVEVGLIASLCHRVPFGLVILVPLALKLAVAFVLRGLLRDLHLPAPWPEVGAAVWLLEPLGTEAALWPSALHVPLGLLLALAALRLYRRDRLVLGTLAMLGACLSIEQVIFALPLAVWLIRPPRRRWATSVAVSVVLTVLVVYALWPGENERQAVGLASRITNVVAEPAWYLIFPAAGLGLHSGLLGLRWAFPLSAVLVLLGAAAGARFASVALGDRPAPPSRGPVTVRGTLMLAALIALVNLPMVATVPRGYSARTFTPTWLVLAGAVAVLGSRIRWRRAHLAGVVAGVAAAMAVVSLAFSVSVRVRTADFTVASSRWLAGYVDQGARVIEVCDVPRTFTASAPVGSFHLHQLHEEWGMRGALQYHTGRVAEFRRAGVYWPRPCPSTPRADLTLSFDELRRAAGSG